MGFVYILNVVQVFEMTDYIYSKASLSWDEMCTLNMAHVIEMTDYKPHYYACNFRIQHLAYSGMSHIH